MKISLIIPTYNRKDFLYQTLLYISEQKISIEHDFEVIVVDDGSTDSTNQLVDKFNTIISSLNYIYRPRDERSCRSLARNLGLKSSSGDVVVFIDCGMVIPPTFIEKIISKYIISNDPNNLVLTHYLVGKVIDPHKDDTSILEQLSPDTITDICNQLKNISCWADRRVGLFDFVSDNLNSYPAPWSVGYDTAALSVPRHLSIKIGGFDENFLGWGGEDHDFAFRLYKEGASFVSIRDAFALHLPHPVEMSIEAKKINNHTNLLKMHRKNYTLETELRLLYSWQYHNQALEKFNKLILEYIIPPYEVEFINDINNNYLSNSQKSLLLGLDNMVMVSKLKSSHIFVLNKTTLNKFKEIPGRTVNYLLGCDTPYEDHFFDIVIISDFCRILGPTIFCNLLSEMRRISKKILIMYSPAFVSEVHLVDGWPWMNESEMLDLIKSIFPYSYKKSSNRLLEITQIIQ